MVGESRAISPSPSPLPLINPSYLKPTPPKLLKPLIWLPFLSISISCNTHRNVAASVSFNPQGNYDLSLLDDDLPNNNDLAAPLPPKQGRFEVVLDTQTIRRLDLFPFQSATSSAEANELLERTIGFSINYTRDDPYDKRELSEYPDVRLWFVRLDATYPWLPVMLDWRAGELARYAAMLVPHQMSMSMGVVFNPEALELFIMNKVFIVYSWLKQHGVPEAKARLKTIDMARMLGFGIGDDLFLLIHHHPLSPSH